MADEGWVGLGVTDGGSSWSLGYDWIINEYVETFTHYGIDGKAVTTVRRRRAGSRLRRLLRHLRRAWRR